MNTYHYIFIYCAILFVVGFIYGQIKSSVFYHALGADRAHEVGFTTILTQFLRNPFSIFIIIFLGAIEILRIAIELFAGVGSAVILFFKLFIRSMFGEYKGASMCYSYVRSWHTVLTKNDLENLAKAYDVPMTHLLEITRTPTWTKVSDLSRERDRMAALSGKQIDQLVKAATDLKFPLTPTETMDMVDTDKSTDDQ